MPTKVDPFADAAEVQSVEIPSATLAPLLQLVSKLQTAQTQVAQADVLLKAAKETERVLREETLPDALSAAGLTSLTLSDGTKVSVEPFLHCSLAGAVKPKAIAWLVKSDNAGLIKNEVKVVFPKGKEKEAQQLMQRLAKAGYTPEQVQDVNTTSFKALVRELLADGQPVPLADVGVYTGREAVITLPKKDA